MKENQYRFELGQVAWCVLGAVTILGRTKFMCPESYLVEIDGEQHWVNADDLSDKEPITN